MSNRHWSHGQALKQKGDGAMTKLLPRRAGFAGLLAGLVLIAIAIAAAAATHAAGTPLNNAGATAPHAVPASTAGMPPTSQVLFAVVNGNGTRARGLGSTAAVRDAPGVYRVTFRQSVSGCAYTGTLGLSGNLGVEQPGEIQVVTANVNPAQVFVTTRDSAGAPAD